MSDSASNKVTIANKLGLHARPAMMFVEAASKFDASITVRRDDTTEGVDGKSIMQMMMLAATQGTDIHICAKGPDAASAVKDLSQLVKSRFSED